MMSLWFTLGSIRLKFTLWMVSRGDTPFCPYKHNIHEEHCFFLGSYRINRLTAFQLYSNAFSLLVALSDRINQNIHKYFLYFCNRPNVYLYQFQFQDWYSHILFWQSLLVHFLCYIPLWKSLSQIFDSS